MVWCGAERRNDLIYHYWLLAIDTSLQVVEATPVDMEAQYRRSAISATGGAAAFIGLGMISPNLAFSNMVNTFALSGIVGYQVGERQPCFPCFAALVLASPFRCCFLVRVRCCVRRE